MPATAISADAAHRWRRLEQPIGRQTEPEREAERDDDHRQTFDPDVRADAAAHGVEHAADASGEVRVVIGRSLGMSSETRSVASVAVK